MVKETVDRRDLLKVSNFAATIITVEELLIPLEADYRRQLYNPNIKLSINSSNLSAFNKRSHQAANHLARSQVHCFGYLLVQFLTLVRF